MKKLDAYIIQKFLGTFFYAILLFAAISVVMDVSEHINDFLEKEAPLKLIITEYYFNFVPFILSLLFPLFVFIAVIFFTSQMAHRSEIVAMLAGGINFYRILMVPYFISATLLVIIQLFGNHYIVPNSNKNRLIFEAEYIRNKKTINERNVHMQIGKNNYVSFESYTSRDTSGRQFTLEQYDDKNNLLYKLSAERIKWNNALKKWHIDNYYVRTIDSLKENIQTGFNLDTTINLNPKDFEEQVKYKETMTTPQLNLFIEKEIKRGASFIEYYYVEKYRRTAIPFATYILTAIGLAIASRKTRGGMGLHILLGVAISSIYIILLQFSMTFATNGNLSPLISVWIPNIIFTFVAIYLLYNAQK